MSDIDQLIQQGKLLQDDFEKKRASEDYDVTSFYVPLTDKLRDSLPFDPIKLEEDLGEEDLVITLEQGAVDRWRTVPEILSEIENQLQAVNNPEQARLTAREFFWRIFEFTQWHVGWWPHYVHDLAAKAPETGNIDIKTATDAAIDTTRRTFYELALLPGGEDWISKSLACLEKNHCPTSQPDADRSTALLDHAYYAAAHAFARKETGGLYSDDPRKAFKVSFNSYLAANLNNIGAASILDNSTIENARMTVSFLSMCKRAYIDDDSSMKSVLDRPESESIKSLMEQISPLAEADVQASIDPSLAKIRDACSQVAVQVLVGIHVFKVNAIDGDWRNALQMYAHILDCFDSVTAEPEFNEDTSSKRNWREAYGYKMWDEWDRHKESLHKEAIEAFTSLRENSSTDTDWSDVYKHVQMVLKAMESELIDPELNHSPYWREARGWLEGSKLEPGELRDELRKEEDEKAEQRLKKYFFADDQWSALPERARKRLVEADRVWYSHRYGDPGITLESLKVAVEETLFDLLWKPCFQWIDVSGNRGLEVLDVLNISNELKKQNRNPSLLEFESMVESKGLATYLSTVDVSSENLTFVQTLRRSLESLRKARTPVAHDNGGSVVTSEQVAPLYKKFLGLGEEGILPRLASIRARLDKRTSLPIRQT